MKYSLFIYLFIITANFQTTAMKEDKLYKKRNAGCLTSSLKRARANHDYVPAGTPAPLPAADREDYTEFVDARVLSLCKTAGVAALEKSFEALSTEEKDTDIVEDTVIQEKPSDEELADFVADLALNDDERKGVVKL